MEIGSIKDNEREMGSVGDDEMEIVSIKDNEREIGSVEDDEMEIGSIKDNEREIGALVRRWKNGISMSKSDQGIMFVKNHK